MDPRAVLSQAIAFHQTGRLADAERLYTQLMAADPREATAHHMLGVVRAQQGRNSEDQPSCDREASSRVACSIGVRLPTDRCTVRLQMLHSTSPILHCH